MTNRHATSAVFKAIPREVAVQKWAGWWDDYLQTHFDGSTTKACLAIFGKGTTGSPRSLSQSNKWRFAENNSLPSKLLIELILADMETRLGREVSASEFVEHDLPFMQVNVNKQGPRQYTGERGAMKKRTDAVFTIDDENVPTPEMSFKGSADHPGYYEFKLDAILPMAGVLAIMALIDDAR